MKKHWIFIMVVLAVSTGCNKITEKIDEKIKQEIDNSMLELRHRMDSLNAITIDSIKSKLDSLQKQSIKLKPEK
ncbi:MAG: hypothetical protein ACP5P3_05410 [Ignavibacteria bacterium]